VWHRRVPVGRKAMNIRGKTSFFQDFVLFGLYRTAGSKSCGPDAAGFLLSNYLIEAIHDFTRSPNSSIDFEVDRLKMVENDVKKSECM
jgi:hypothetical protein